jgi:hypothetical protein
MGVYSRYWCSYCIDCWDLGLFHQETKESKRTTFPELGADSLKASDGKNRDNHRRDASIAIDIENTSESIRFTG